MRYTDTSLNHLKESQLSFHCLKGLSYSVERNPSLRQPWRDQLIKNQLIKAELFRLGKEFSKNEIKPTLLKGFALMGSLYEDWGARFASDVDFLIEATELDCMSELLESQGFIRDSEIKWRGDDFKTCFRKETKLFEITLEVHTRLFWHSPKRVWSKRDCLAIPGFSILSPEEQLLHLCGHLGFQHNFLKLFWLYDIDLFLQKRAKDIDWNCFYKMAEKDSLTLSCAMSFYLVNYEKRWKGLPIVKKTKLYLLKKLINGSYLLDPKKHGIRYFLVKNLIKDRAWESVQYLWSWSCHRLSKLKARGS